MQFKNWTHKLLSGGLACLAIALLNSQATAQCPSCGGAGGAWSAGGSAQHGMYNSAEHLFDNYFTQGPINQAQAGMYISPVGVPGWVGHTYITYEPFQPHEFMYHHRHRYHSYYDSGAGLNRTMATYYNPPVRTAVGRTVKFLSH